jgi:hypothetical protein
MKLSFYNYLNENVLGAASNLNEATFKLQNIEHLCDLYGKLLGKKFGAPFQLVGTEKYVKSGDKGVGVRMLNNNGQMLRFNFSAAKKGFNQEFIKDAVTVSSIDYWKKGNTDFEKPTLNISFNASVNVLEIWAGLAKIINSNKKGKFKLDDFDNEKLQESSGLLNESITDLRCEFLESHGLKKSYGTLGKTTFLDYISKNNLADEWEEFSGIEVTDGKKETNGYGDNIRKMEDKFDKQVYSDPKYVFQDIEELTSFIAKGGSKSLIICGMGGVGKTYHVTTQLKKILGEQGFKWEYHSGMKVSARSFYATIYRERDKCVVLDEADSFLLNDDIVMMLKPALDTSGDNRMEYAVMTKQPAPGQPWSDLWAETDAKLADGCQLVYGNKETDNTVIIPGRFIFKGQMIFISNLNADKIEDAIKSRSLYVDVQLSAEDRVKRIKTIMAASAACDEAEADEVFEALGATVGAAAGKPVQYMTPELARQLKPVTVRSMVIALSLKHMGFERWQHLASMYA